jgi:hypothetical protein
LGVFAILAGEEIKACVSQLSSDLDTCESCGQISYRTLLIISIEGVLRASPLCGRHFMEALQAYPEIGKVESGPVHNRPAVSPG